MLIPSLDADRDRVIKSLVLGFASDPFIRWLFPDPSDFLSIFPQLARLFGGGAFETGTAHHLDGYSGATLWLPPGRHPDEDGLVALFQGTFNGRKLEQVFSLFEQMDQCHPSDPCWHLAFIAVDPFRQGKGLGTALLSETLKQCDADGKVAYLESTNPANLSLYRRHGFVQTGLIETEGAPPLYPMIRQPRQD